MPHGQGCKKPTTKPSFSDAYLQGIRVPLNGGLGATVGLALQDGKYGPRKFRCMRLKNSYHLLCFPQQDIAAVRRPTSMKLPFGVFLDLRTNCKPTCSLDIIPIRITSLLHCVYRCPTDVPLLHVCPVVHARCHMLNTRIILVHPEHRLALALEIHGLAANETRSQRVSVPGQHRPAT